MPYDYKYYEDEGYLLTKLPKIVLLADALAYFDKMIADPSIRKSFFEIADFSNTKEIDFGYEDARILILKIAKLKRLGNYRGSLLIADKGYIRGMTNIYRVVAESANINVIQVTSLDGALDIVKEHIA